MTQPHDDDPLRARLRAVDPAAALPPLPTGRLDRLLEDAMTSPDTRTVRSRRAPWFIGGGVGIAAAAAGIIALTTGGTDVTRLTQPASDPLTTMCAEVTSEALAGKTLAFEGTVTGIDGSTVTLDVTQAFRGEVGDEVQVTQQDAAADDFSAVQYTQGTSYLISATDGQVASCGQSGEASPELLDLYRTAFGS